MLSGRTVHGEQHGHQAMREFDEEAARPSISENVILTQFSSCVRNSCSSLSVIGHNAR